MKSFVPCFLLLFLAGCSSTQDSNSAIITSNWIVAIGTAVLAFVAIFQDKIRGCLMHPILKVSIQPESPDCHKTFIRSNYILKNKKILYTHRIRNIELDANAYYFRIRVTNVGNQKAENVEVFANQLSERMEDGTYKSVGTFFPMNLNWTHIGGLFFPTISPHIYKHCDLFHVVDPKTRGQLEAEDKKWEKIPPTKTILSFDTIVRPNTLGHLVKPGSYKLVLTIAAANAKPITKSIEITLTGDWFETEEEMFTKGVLLSELK
jgi:hypothetical protein